MKKSRESVGKYPRMGEGRIIKIRFYTYEYRRVWESNETQVLSVEQEAMLDELYDDFKRRVADVVFGREEVGG